MTRPTSVWQEDPFRSCGPTEAGLQYNAELSEFILMYDVESLYLEGTMSINWLRDADGALAQARQQNKPLLLDFSAAPM